MERNCKYSNEPIGLSFNSRINQRPNHDCSSDDLPLNVYCEIKILTEKAQNEHSRHHVAFHWLDVKTMKELAYGKHQDQVQQNCKLCYEQFVAAKT